MIVLINTVYQYLRYCDSVCYILCRVGVPSAGKIQAIVYNETKHFQ